MEEGTNTTPSNLVETGNMTLHATASTSAGALKSSYLPKEDNTSKKMNVTGKSSEQCHSTTVSLHTAVELQVFKNFVKNYAASRELRREDAIALDFMFGPTIQQVFEMVEEEDQVTIRRSPITGRVLVEVCGKTATYWIPPGHSLCQCMAYIHMRKGYCKHVLAAHLSLAITPKEKYKVISDIELNNIYKENFS